MRGRLRARRRAAVRASRPPCCRDFRLGLLGKYLCFAIVAVGIGLAWGRGGMLTLGPGRVLRPRRLPDGHAPQARRRRPAATTARLHALIAGATRCPAGGSRSPSRVVHAAGDRRCCPTARRRGCSASRRSAAGSAARTSRSCRRRWPPRLAILLVGQHDEHRRHQRPQRLPGVLRLQPVRPGQPADAVLHRRRRAAARASRWSGSSCRAATASCWWPCATARSGCASSATTRPTSRSSPTSSRP